MAVFDPMALATVKLSKQWSIEGGRLTKPYGLDVKEIDSTGGPLSFVRIDKNAEWLLNTLFGKVAKGSLRRSSIFRTLETILQKDSPLSPEHAQESSPSSAVADTSSPTVADTSSPAVAESEPFDPMSQVEEISSNFSTPKKARKGPYKSKRGQNNIQIATMPEYEPLPHPRGMKSGRPSCCQRARTRCTCRGMDQRRAPQ